MAVDRCRETEDFLLRHFTHWCDASNLRFALRDGAGFIEQQDIHVTRSLNRPAGQGARRKNPFASVVVRKVSSIPLTVMVTFAKGRSVPSGFFSEAKTRPSIPVVESARVESV